MRRAGGSPGRAMPGSVGFDADQGRVGEIGVGGQCVAAFAAPDKEPCMNLLTAAILLAFGATVYSLVCGMSSMASHGEIAHHTSEQWMVRRVVFQALTVVLLLFAIAQ